MTRCHLGGKGGNVPNAILRGHELNAPLMRTASTSPLRSYLQVHFWGVQHAHMLNMRRSLSALFEFLLWTVPATLFVLFVSWLEPFHNIRYLQAAIDQGIGPELWNVAGCFGFSLFGTALLWPRAQITRAAAHYVLNTAFGMGALTYGLLIGKSIVAIKAATVQAWQAWFWGAGIGLLFLLVAAFNFAIWHAALLCSPMSQREGGFLFWWANRPLILRASIAACVTLLPIALLSAER